MILQPFITATVVIPFLTGTLGLSNLNQNQKKDPPARFEGIVKSVDDSNPNSVFLTIAVKEMRPDDGEDEVVPIEKLSVQNAGQCQDHGNGRQTV